MMPMIRKTALLLIAMLFSASAWASQTSSPQTVVDTTINEIIKVLDARKDKTTLSEENISAISKISKKRINYKYIASRILGRTTWKKLLKLEKQQQKPYTDNYVTHYSQWLEIYMAEKLSQYKGQTIKRIENKTQNKTDPNPKYPTVRLTVDNKIKLDFTLRKFKPSWMIIDFTVEGISIPKSIEYDLKGFMNGPDTMANYKKMIAHIDMLKSKIKEKVQN